MTRRGIKSVAAKTALAILCAAQVAPAQTGVGSASPAAKSAAHIEILKNYLAAFNSGDAEGLKKFAAERLGELKLKQRGVTPEQVAQFELRFRQRIGGGLDLYRVEKDADGEIISTLKTRGEFPLYVRMDWKFDAASPNIITERDLSPIDTPADTLPPKAAAEAVAKEVDAKLSKLTAEDKFSGAVLIAKDGRAIFQKAYGYADREAKIPNNLETRFRLGSMNKMFTSVAVAQLVQAGKLKYTDTLAQVLPDYPDKEIAQKITIHHLLTHTSGLGDIFTPEFDKKKDSLHEIKEYLPLFTGKPLKFEPGKSWAYSNAGFIVLGLIIEKVSGESYYDYVQQHIYDAAGMKSSGSFPKTEKVANLAVGYMRQGADGKLVSNWETLPWRGMSAGGGDSTLGDLLRFDQALRAHKLLNAEMTETILTGKVQPGPQENRKYAYGFEDHLLDGRHVVGHSGGAPGMNSELDIDLKKGYTIIVLANIDPPAAQLVASYITERLE